jgi:hypothetical protein
VRTTKNASRASMYNVSKFRDEQTER